MSIDTILYRTEAKVTGGRDGRAVSSDGALDVNLAMPKELGGNGASGTNPEQLFAAGYSACFLSAMNFVASQQKQKLPEGTSVTGRVGIGQIPAGFGIEVELYIQVPGFSRDEAEELAHKAHAVCPYSNATRDNIDVTLNVA